MLVERTFGPASRQTRALESALRRTWLPVARTWRLTPRGVRLLQRATEPGRRVPALRGTRVEALRVAGRPAEWVLAPHVQPAARGGPRGPAMLYLHGGGYVFGSPRTFRNLVSRISHATGLPALSLDYRLPPAATLPAPVEDALGAYRHLLDAGHPPERLVVAGDSAGGNLALALVLHLAEEGLPQPAALVLISPWADLTMSGASFTRNGLSDPFIPPVALHRFARVALGELDAADWRASPLFAPAALWPALPRTLIQVGTTELMHDDAVRVAHRLAEAGVDAELQRYERQPHVAPLWTGTPEARTALHEIGRFTAAALARSAPPSAPPAPRREPA